MESHSVYDNDVHVVTNVIKGFIRDGLPPKMEPLCPYDKYDEFIKAPTIEDKDVRLARLQDLVWSLPSVNRVTLKFLCEHLFKVAENREVNKMSIQNLSIIFAPNILRSADNSLAREMLDMNAKCAVMMTLIEYVKWIF
ncbi:Rho GTPase activation protein, partial [Polychytrium aggregatum]|uniref:Rho GTPase activation protein n=1 Tax=Polychytrium aggregatum TaxID=110093 RepID=UPI0022FE8D58